MRDSESTHLNDGDLDRDDLFSVLSNARRRYVLSYLCETDDDVVELSDLVDWITAQEADGEGAQHEAVAISLHHTHLPELAARGVIDYDARSETIHYHGQPKLERLLAWTDERVCGSFTPTENKRKAAIDQLEEALRATDGDRKDVHIREAIQLLHLADRAAPTGSNGVNETAK